MHRSIRRLASLLLLGGVCALVGCRQDESSADRASAKPASAQSELRIASLSPALTRTAVSLGLSQRIVGRTRWCDGIPSTIAIIGDLQEFDAERLVRLAPTDLLVQPPAAGIDPGLRALAARHGWRVHAFPLDGLADIDGMLAALPSAMLDPTTADGAALRARAEAARAAIRTALDARPAAVAQAGPTAILFAIEPPLAFGRGSYLGDIFEALGGVNAVATAGYPAISLEDLYRLAPRTIVLVAGEGSMLKASALDHLELEAVKSGRVVLLVHDEAMRPGPGVPALARALIEALEALGAPDAPDAKEALDGLERERPVPRDDPLGDAR